MGKTNSLGALRARLSPLGQQRLFEFLDAINTESAARFRSWLAVAAEDELSAAADLLNRASHGRDFAAWWHSRDKVPATQTVSSSARQQSSSPLQHLHRQAYAQAANRDLTVGGAWLLGGVLVTVVSYNLAASTGGSHFLIASGAILYGLIRVFRGMSAR